MISDLVDRYVSCLKSYNETTNVYSKKAYDKLDFHIEDSLVLAELIGDRGALVYDFGSGSGLPSIPLAIATPSNHVVAFESKSRKSNFLCHAADQIGLENYDVVAQNIVEVGRDIGMDCPDVITAKAFAPYERMEQYTKYFTGQGTELYLPISKTQYDVYQQLKIPEIELICKKDRFYYLHRVY